MGQLLSDSVETSLRELCPRGRPLVVSTAALGDDAWLACAAARTAPFRPHCSPQLIAGFRARSGAL
jgi:hypothetical protein